MKKNKHAKFLGSLKRDTHDPMLELRERAARALGESVQATMSMSLPALGAMLRGRGEVALADEISQAVRTGEIIRGARPSRQKVRGTVHPSLLFDTPTGAPSDEDVARAEARREAQAAKEKPSAEFVLENGQDVERFYTEQAALTRGREIFDLARKRGQWPNLLRIYHSGKLIWWSPQKPPEQITGANFIDAARQAASDVLEHAGRKAATMSQAAMEALAMRDWHQALVMKAGQKFESDASFRRRLEKPDTRGFNYLVDRMRVWLPAMLGPSWASVESL